MHRYPALVADNIAETSTLDGRFDLGQELLKGDAAENSQLHLPQGLFMHLAPFWTEPC